MCVHDPITFLIFFVQPRSMELETCVAQSEMLLPGRAWLGELSPISTGDSIRNLPLDFTLCLKSLPMEVGRKVYCSQQGRHNRSCWGSTSFVPNNGLSMPRPSSCSHTSSGCQGSQSLWSYQRKTGFSRRWVWVRDYTSFPSGPFCCQTGRAVRLCKTARAHSLSKGTQLHHFQNPHNVYHQCCSIFHFSGDNSSSLWNQMTQSRLELFREARS